MKIPSAKTLAKKLRIGEDDAAKTRDAMERRLADLPDVGDQRAEYFLQDMLSFVCGSHTSTIRTPGQPTIVYISFGGFGGSSARPTLMFVGGKIAIDTLDAALSRGQYVC